MMVMGISPANTAAARRSAPGTPTSSASIPYLRKMPSSFATQAGATAAAGVFNPMRSGTGAGGGDAALGAPLLAALAAGAAVGAAGARLSPPAAEQPTMRRPRSTS